MKIGVIDLLTDTLSSGWLERPYGTYFRRQLFSIAPQAVSVWCRQLGHDVHYATFYGQRDPLRLLPDDLDVVFVAAYTQASALAYALAKIYRKRKTLTVIGGPHAKSFPRDCKRFFDLVVEDCDKALVAEILSGHFDPPAVITSGRPLTDIPPVEERMPEIGIATFHRGKPTRVSVVPMLSSIGCPYNCNFCVDWNNDYVALPQERLKADLEYLSENWPSVIIGYHDPNFAVRFDETMDIIESVPAGRRNPYIMESSLSILKESRLPRLRETNCCYVAPGVESWADYSGKAGVGGKHGRDKLEQVLAHLEAISEFVGGLQANFVFGTDGDRGSEPVELTMEFVKRAPSVWPTFNIPTPYGGTPLYDQYYAEGRLLKSLPFAFYFNPFLAITPNNYHPIEYYDHMISMQAANASAGMLARRLRSPTTHAKVKFVMALRTAWSRRSLRRYQEIGKALASDTQFRLFHEGRTSVLPRFYHQLFEKRLGRYAELISRADRIPMLKGPAEQPPEVADAPAPNRLAPSRGLDPAPLGAVGS